MKVSLFFLGFFFGIGCYEIFGIKDGIKFYREEGDLRFLEFVFNLVDIVDRS